MQESVIPKEFFRRPTLELSRALLGTVLVHETGEGTTSGYIVEVEAYTGEGDRAAHTRSGITDRTRVLFGPPGFAYVYQIYGVHYCFNVSSGEEETGDCILVRALQPLRGKSLMAGRRGIRIDESRRKTLKPLTNGPGKLCSAMGIGLECYGSDLSSSSLRIVPGARVAEGRIASGPRVGIDYAGEDALLPWRFWVLGNSFVSR